MNKIQINKPKFKRGDIAYYIDKEKISYMYNISSTCPNYDFDRNENDLYLTKDEALQALIEQITYDAKILPNSWEELI